MAFVVYEDIFLEYCLARDYFVRNEHKGNEKPTDILSHVDVV